MSPSLTIVLRSPTYLMKCFVCFNVHFGNNIYNATVVRLVLDAVYVLLY